MAIITGIINNPMILFADEPTATLDSLAALEVLEIFTKLNHDGGHTIVMVTHEDEETKYANRLVRLSDGRIIDDRRTG